MQQKLKEILSRRQKHRIIDDSKVRAAVLIPIYYKEGEYYILFTKRTETLKNHKGQISFPGGAYEEKDRILLNTALRECAEEIGLADEGIEILGELDDMLTTTSGYIISPFVAVIPWPCSLRIHQKEVEELVEVPISALLDENCVRQDTDVIDGQPVNAYFYNYQGKIIWGATARILHQFLDIIKQVMKEGERGSE
jgi:8-oxo-dGTP pyrophosphatase MutT (NUDIX family)